MKAFRVRYGTPNYSNNMTVLANEKSDVPSMIANKDKSFQIGGLFKEIYKVSFIEEIPLSNVMVSDLSVTELLQLQKGETD